MRRRTYLTAIGVATFAGCSDLGGDGTDETYVDERVTSDSAFEFDLEPDRMLLISVGMDEGTAALTVTGPDGDPILEEEAEGGEDTTDFATEVQSSGTHELTVETDSELDLEVSTTTSIE